MKLTAAISFVALLPVFSYAQDTNKCPSLEVRKEWRSFTKAERKAWIDANNCLNKKPSKGKLKLEVDTSSYNNPAFHIPPYNASGSHYDDLVYAHMNLNPVIHFTGQFLPWHRVYLFEWTKSLRNECGYKGVVPYWAWEKDTDDFEGSMLWDADPQSGLGGFSNNSSDDYTIHDGALDLHLAYPIPHKLRRHYIPYPYDIPVANFSKVKATDTFTPAEIKKLLAQPEGNFTKFQAYLEQPIGMHSSIHIMMGG
ncbi:tyrosinase, putative [Rhizoctonia solani AG-1 IB]|uniref:Tyrosinase, putative n=2 Tax=Thanatephorus cucumeris (strain AG1-IB / isolate 7/3/14) TaxID=1108050 RepID=M5CEV9_THACB|nr:tyrosinase, putative [Rhizoctonia solani AG-1 IB]